MRGWCSLAVVKAAVQLGSIMEAAAELEQTQALSPAILLH